VNRLVGETFVRSTPATEASVPCRRRLAGTSRLTDRRWLAFDA
jgi:hypothetical protein